MMKRHRPAEQTRRPAPNREQCRNWLSVGVAVGGFVGCRLLLHIFCIPVGGLLLWRTLRRGVRTRRRTWVALGVAAALIWVGLYSLFTLLPAMELWGHSTVYRGTVSGYPQRERWGWSMEVRLQAEDRGSVLPVLLHTTQSCERCRPGDSIALKGALRSPGAARQERLLRMAARGIFAETKSVKRFKSVSAAHPFLRSWPKLLQRRIKEKILRQSSPEQAGLLLALLTGDTEELSEELDSNLRRSGMRHIAAVSGLHVSVLVSALLLLPVERRARQLLAAAVLVLCCLLTGARPSMLRATVMGLALLLGPFLRRDADSVASLRTALLLLFLHNPYSLLDIGLQLSFAATLGILRLYQPLYRGMLKEENVDGRERLCFRLRKAVVSSLALSLSALAFTTPLTALYFGTLSLAAPLSNLLCLGAVELYFLGGVLMTLLPVTPLLSVPMGWLWTYLRWAMELTANLPLSALSMEVGWYVLWLAAVYAVAVWLWRSEGRHWPLWTAALCVLLLLSVQLHRSELGGTGLGVEAVDVGQGQSILLLSDSTAAAVDCGGADAGNALAGAMDDVLESRLDLLVLTHYDEDHINGLERLFDRVQVTELVLPDVKDDSAGRERVERLAKAHGIPTTPLREKQSRTLGRMTLHLFPPVGERSDNDACLTVLAEKEDFSVLITGDLSAEGERALLEREKLGAVDVLVAGHHGSRGSTCAAFLERIRPKTVILSCGAGNSYGHPHKETLERLAAAGCTVRRTDRNGRVSIGAFSEDG